MGASKIRRLCRASWCVCCGVLAYASQNTTRDALLLSLLRLRPSFERAPCGPGRRSRRVEILDVAQATPAVSKQLRPWPEPQSTLSERPLLRKGRERPADCSAHPGVFAAAVLRTPHKTPFATPSPGTITPPAHSLNNRPNQRDKELCDSACRGMWWKRSRSVFKAPNHAQEQGAGR